MSDTVPACGRAGATRSQFPTSLCRGAGGRRCPQGTLPAEAFVADVKFVRDTSTKGSRQVKWVIFPFLTREAPSLEFFESKLKIQTGSNSWFGFAAAGFGRLLSARVVQEVSLVQMSSSSLKNNDSMDPGRGLVESRSIL